jgi:hypothetical protein
MAAPPGKMYNECETFHRKGYEGICPAVLKAINDLIYLNAIPI